MRLQVISVLLATSLLLTSGCETASDNDTVARIREHIQQPLSGSVSYTVAYKLHDIEGAERMQPQMEALGAGVIVTESLHECFLQFQGDKYLYVENQHVGSGNEFRQTVVYDGTHAKRLVEQSKQDGDGRRQGSILNGNPLQLDFNPLYKTYMYPEGLFSLVADGRASINDVSSKTVDSMKCTVITFKIEPENPKLFFAEDLADALIRIEDERDVTTITYRSAGGRNVPLKIETAQGDICDGTPRSTRTITCAEDWTLGEPIPEETFMFEFPEGVEVITAQDAP